MDNNAEKLIYNFLLAYGFLPCLKAIETLEEKEEYELCGAILKVLKKHFSRFGIDFPKRYGKEAVKQMKGSIQKNFGLSGNIAEENTNCYANILLEQLIDN